MWGTRWRYEMSWPRGGRTLLRPPAALCPDRAGRGGAARRRGRAGEDLRGLLGRRGPARRVHRQPAPAAPAAGRHGIGARRRRDGDARDTLGLVAMAAAGPWAAVAAGRPPLCRAALLA